LNSLIDADLKGIHTHGLMRLPIYIRRIQAGLINSCPELEFNSLNRNISILDADNALGQVAGVVAMKKVVEQASSENISIVLVKNSNHFGAAGYYTEIAANEKMIGFCSTNSFPLMAITGGYERVIGNNPFSLSFPRKKPNNPLVFDMSCSKVPVGKILLYESQGRQIPKDWALDCNGNPTTDAYAAYRGGGALLPVGEHKGYGLALMMEILTSIISGSYYGKEINSLYDLTRGKRMGLSHYFMAININSFISEEQFFLRLENLLGIIKNSKCIDNNYPIMLPGEIEANRKAQAIQNGIILEKKKVQEILGMCEEFGVEVPMHL